MVKEFAILDSIPLEEQERADITEEVKEIKSLPAQEAISENKNDNVADILARLAKIREVSVEEGVEKYQQEVEYIESQSESYFIKQKARQIVKPPLADLDNEGKRIFLKNNWQYFCRYLGKYQTIADARSGQVLDFSQIEALDPLLSADMDDTRIERFFNAFRDLDPDRYFFEEADRYENKYNDRDISDNYKMPATELTVDYPYYYSRLNSSYAASYNMSSGEAARFYKLDEQTEKNIKAKQAVAGSILDQDLEDAVIAVEEAKADQEAERLNDYIFIRNGLPEHAKKELDAQLGLKIPVDAPARFCSREEFNIWLHKNSQNIRLECSPENLDFVLDKLRKLLDDKRRISTQENNGFGIGNLPTLKNIGNSYLNVLEGRYYWFEDYLRQKRFLPADLVREFESNFSFDFNKYAIREFPFFDSAALKDIEQNKLKIQEPFHWLGREILKKVETVNAGRAELKEIELTEIMAEEGIDQNNLPALKDSLANYKAMMDLQTRKSIEDEFGIELRDFSFRQQVQFVNYLSTKAPDEVEKVKEFLGRDEEEKNRVNRVKSFLALESGSLLGNQILSIGEELKNNPKQADKLFAEYAQIVDKVSQSADDLVRMYNEIFFDKQISGNKAGSAILNKAFGLLEKANIELKASDKKEEIIEDLISGLKKQEKIQKTILGQLEGLVVGVRDEELETFNNMMDDVMGLYFYDYDKSYEYSFYDEYSKKMTDEERKNFSHDFDCTVSRKHYNLEHESERGQYIMTYVDLWKKHGINPSFIIDKYISDVIKNEKGYTWAEDVFDKKEGKDSRYGDNFRKNTVIWQKKQADIQKLKKNCQNRFMSEIYGESVGLTEELKNHISNKVFKKYQEIVDQANVNKVRLKELFNSDKDINDKDIDKISDLVMQKANNFLQQNTKSIIKGKIKEEEILDELENYKADNVLAFSILAGMRDLRPEQLKGVEFEARTAGDLTRDGRLVELLLDSQAGQAEVERDDEGRPFLAGASLRARVSRVAAEADSEERQLAEQLLRMADLYASRYRDNPKLQAKLLASFWQRLKSGGEQVNCYNYKKDGRVEAAIIYDKRGPVKHFNSFISTPESERSGFGLRLLDESLKIEMADEQEELIGECNSAAPISAKYIGPGYGFVAEKAMPDYEGTGILAYGIHLAPANQDYHFLHMSKAELSAEYVRNEAAYRQGRIELSDSFICRYQLGSAEHWRDSAELINERGYVLTNYSLAPDKQNVYCAFEKRAG